jgi:hypothetical protein
VQKRVVHFDSETYAFARGDRAPRVVCFSVKDEVGNRLLDRDEGFRWLEGELDRAGAGDVLLTGSYVAYDMTCTVANRPDLARKVFAAYAADGVSCSQSRDKLLDIADGTLRGGFNNNGDWISTDYGLDDMVARYLRRGMNKGPDSWRTRYRELDGIPIPQWPEQARAYALDDSDGEGAVWLAQRDRARRMGYHLPTEALEVRADLALALTQAWGIRTDPERVEVLAKRTEARIGELADVLVDGRIARAVGKGQRLLFEPGAEEPGEISTDTKTIRRLIESTWPKGIGEIPRTEKTNEIQTSKEVLELCDHPALEALIEFNALRKSGSTYVRKLMEGIDGPIHARFDVLGAASTRTSCSGPNLQNQPRLPGVRECFIPRFGHVFLSCDYTTQEMRTFAQTLLDLLGWSHLAERFKDPKFDPHLELAADEIGMDLVRAYELLGIEDPFVMDPRQQAKIANFGLPGGMGTPGLIRYAKGYGAKWSVEQAEKKRSAWGRKWPESAGYFAEVRRIVGEANCGRVVIPQSGLWRGMCAYTDACNSFFQTLAAHCTKAALFEVARRCYTVETSALYGARIVNMIHDELLLEVDEEWAHETAMELRQVMIDAMQKFTPDIPAAADAKLMRRWSKKAKTLKDKHGRLIPWDDVKRAA